jgi:hypothetical protein
MLTSTRRLRGVSGSDETDARVAPLILAWVVRALIVSVLV